MGRWSLLVWKIYYVSKLIGKQLKGKETPPELPTSDRSLPFMTLNNSSKIFLTVRPPEKERSSLPYTRINGDTTDTCMHMCAHTHFVFELALLEGIF